MNTNDPVALVCGVVLILMLLFLIFLIICLSRRSAQDTWNDYRHNRRLTGTLESAVTRRTKLVDQVRKAWSIPRRKPVNRNSLFIELPGTANVSSTRDSLTIGQVVLISAPTGPRNARTGTMVTNASRLPEIRLQAVDDTGPNDNARHVSPRDPARLSAASAQKQRHADSTIDRSVSLRRWLPRFPFENGRRYIYLPYVSGDASGPDLEAKLNVMDQNLQGNVNVRGRDPQQDPASN